MNLNRAHASVSPINDFELASSSNPIVEGGAQGPAAENQSVSVDSESVANQPEAIEARAARVPVRPTQAEIDLHMTTHLPFRSWCAHCVRGKSKGKPHHKAEGEPKEVPTVAIDYMFMHESQDIREEKGMPILVARDLIDGGHGTGMIFARVVPNKGVQPYAVKNLAADIALLGHPEIVLKSDGEPSIVALKEAVKMERPERIAIESLPADESAKLEMPARMVLESSPVKESRSNGAIENAIQQVQGQFRAIKDGLESRLGERVKGDSPLVPWMVLHAARTLNRYHVSSDGKTAYRRWKGKDFKRDIAEFGESVMYLKPGTEGRDKFCARWERGIWLGIRDETNEIIIGTELGVVKARDFKRMASSEERWNCDFVHSMRGTPWEPTPGKTDDAIPVRVRLPEEGRPPEPVNLGEPSSDIKRRARISREDVVRIGFTIGCPGCKAISRNAPSQNHTDACRTRIEEALIEEGGTKAKRVAEGNQRFDEHMSKKRASANPASEQQSQHSRPKREPEPVPAEPSQSSKSCKRSDVPGEKRERDVDSQSEEQPPHKHQAIEDDDVMDPEGDKSMISAIAEETLFSSPCALDSTVFNAVRVVAFVTCESPERLVAQTYWDDLSGRQLIPGMVQRARQDEMGELAKHQVYTKVPLSECWRNTGKEPIGTRWVDVNKGDDANPDYRSRLVAQEINDHKREDLFAATPPLESKKMLLSLAVTEGIGFQRGCKSRGHKLDFIDVRRAYFHALARRLVYVKLPSEDAEPGMCGKLSKALYGTRDAAQNWEHAYTEFLEGIGFVTGVATPCMFWNEARDIRIVVHGDDFTVLGPVANLDWFRSEIAKRFEVKFRGRLGPEPNDDKAIRILNRVVQWTNDGIEYEADQRHAELIVRQLGLSKSSNSVGTPSAKDDNCDEAPLDPQDATVYRAIAARANYLSQDRADLGFAVKELCRRMSNPRKCDWDKLKRLGRYLVNRTRVVAKFAYQEMPESLIVWSDTDHAGCLTTRKSTSGGVAMFGSHCAKAWSVTQQLSSGESVIALSSGEAEYYGLVKAGSTALGLQGMLKDVGVHIQVVVCTDSSAAKGIASRRGLGKVRHIELSELWLQNHVARGKISIVKVRGEDNFSDSLTKHASAERIAQTMHHTGQSYANGRHAIMPAVAK